MAQFAVEPQFVEPELRLVPARILDITVKPKTRSMHRFDIEVEGTHNYFVDGVMVHNSPETTSGGKALKFYASIRLDVRRIETLKDGQESVGNRVRVKVVKNKMSPPFRQAEMDLMFGTGISREGGLIDVGVEQGFVRKAGAWYTYEGDQLGQGKENARAFLRDNPDLADELEKRIKEKLGIGPRVDAPADEPPAVASPSDILSRPEHLRSARASTVRGTRAGEPARPGRDPHDGPPAGRRTARARPGVGGPADRAAQAHRGAAHPGPARRRPAPPRRPRRRGRRSVLDRFTEVGLVDDAAFAEAGSVASGAARALPPRPAPTSCAPRASTTRPSPTRSTRSTRTTSATAAAALVARRLPALARARPGGADSAGWSGCSRARATPAGWPCGWCGTRLRPTRRRDERARPS